MESVNTATFKLYAGLLLVTVFLHCGIPSFTSVKDRNTSSLVDGSQIASNVVTLARI